MAVFKTLLGVSSAAIALASPLNVDLEDRQTSSHPCAQVSVVAEGQPAAATPTVAASLAYKCITSVPFNQAAALELVEGVKPYFRFQSNTAWLKDPPAEYVEKVQDAVDIWGKLEEIKGKAEANEYKNEWEFGWELYTLLQSTHDGHFVYIPDVIGSVFNWARPVPLVSVSSDGKELPEPYVYSDILAETVGNATFKPSPVTKINGEDAKTFLQNWAQYGSLQDRDALYNNVFYELAVVSLGPVGSGIGTFAGSGRGRWVYPGEDTELEFANGTTKTFHNFAKVLADFDGVSSGEGVWRNILGKRPTPTDAPLNSSTPTPTATPSRTPIPAPGYPPPVIREAQNLIGGYYMEDDYSDIAVLSVPSFSATDGVEVPFQQVAERFLAMAKAAGKKKLIVDVQANGGGIILQGYDLYKQLFPKGVDHAAADRFRAHESVDIMGEKFSNISEGLPRRIVSPEENETLWALEFDVVSSLLNYQTDVDEDGKNFESWEDKFGPVEAKGDAFSNLFRWNLSDVLTPYNSGGIYIHGYGNLTNFTQPFAAEDIVVVTDGYCASTCTIFSELMRQRAGVRYISLGGRPREGLTQAIGGVKGTNNWPWTYIQALAQYTINNLSSAEEGAYYNTTELGDYWDEVVFDRQAVGSSINVNMRDGIRDDDLAEGDESEVPLQFVYEESDCRILYTKEMTVDVTAIWKAVANSAWDGFGTSSCIAGELGSGHYKRNVKRELSPRDKVLSTRMHQWRRSLKASDYPLDVYTDLRKARLDDDGHMWP